MRFSIAQSRLEKLFAQRNGYMMLAAGSIVICLMQTLLIFFLVGREKIILVPPSIEKSFWVSAQHVSPEYLSEMTNYFANLRFNMTSASASMQRENLLRYIDPAYYNVLKAELIKEEDQIIKEHISIAFFPVDIKTDVKNFRALIDGDIKSYIGDTALPTKRVRYLVTYRYNAGRLLVKSFEEVKHA